ncbi:MAG: helix-turn-helix domain-containing protein [Aerococcaceae bacterium]|nr:helix-turn-helix domain-containing protein [Aerococcaceae bacterium]
MLEKILAIFPQARIHSLEQSNGAYETFYYLDQKIDIPTADLTTTHRALLELLLSTSQHETPITTGIHQKWATFLMGEGDWRPDIASVRFIHLHLSHTIEWLVWQDTLLSAMPDILAVVPFQAHHITLVATPSVNIDDLATLLHALDSDFDCVTQGCVGHIYTVNATLPATFSAENHLVQQLFLPKGQATLLPLSAVILQSIGQTAVQQFPILQSIKQAIAKTPEYGATILALIEHQGNLTHAAEQLFVHRNTLTYRLNKFTKETGLNLQFLPDLMLCYLSL